MFLHNKRDIYYNLYYNVEINIQLNKYGLDVVDKAIADLENKWEVPVKQSIEIIGVIDNKLEQSLEEKEYVKSIFEDLRVYKRDNYRASKDNESTYYGYISYFRQYDRTQDGNKFSNRIKFIFNPITKQTQVILQLPAKI